MRFYNFQLPNRQEGEFKRSWIYFIQTTQGIAIQVEEELLTLPQHLSPPPVFSGVRVTRSLVLCVCFVDRCLSFCTFSVGHCVVCSSIYKFWLPLWYLQTLLIFCTKDRTNWWQSLTTAIDVELGRTFQISEMREGCDNCFWWSLEKNGSRVGTEIVVFCAYSFIETYKRSL